MSSDGDADDLWKRVRKRLTSRNVALMREVRRLIDLPASEAFKAIEPILATDEVERLRELFTMLTNVSHNLRTHDPPPSGRTLARQRTATLLANELGNRIVSLGYPTRTLTPEMIAQQGAYVSLSRRLMVLADWTHGTEAEARRIIAELEELRSTDLVPTLTDAINEAIATAWCGIGDHLDQVSTLAAATEAYHYAIGAFDAAGQKVSSIDVRLKLAFLRLRLAVDFDGAIRQMRSMLEELETQEPSLERARVYLKFAETYELIGDKRAALAQIKCGRK